MKNLEALLIYNKIKELRHLILTTGIDSDLKSIAVENLADLEFRFYQEYKKEK